MAWVLLASVVRQLYCHAFGDRFKQMICLTLGLQKLHSRLLQDSIICLTYRLQKRQPDHWPFSISSSVRACAVHGRLPTSLEHPRAAPEYTTAPWKCLFPISWHFGFCQWHFKAAQRLMLLEGGKESYSGRKNRKYPAQHLVPFVWWESWIGKKGTGCYQRLKQWRSVGIKMGAIYLKPLGTIHLPFPCKM